MRKDEKDGTKGMECSIISKNVDDCECNTVDKFVGVSALYVSL